VADSFHHYDPANCRRYVRNRLNAGSYRCLRGWHGKHDQRRSSLFWTRFRTHSHAFVACGSADECDGIVYTCWYHRMARWSAHERYGELHPGRYQWDSEFYSSGHGCMACGSARFYWVIWYRACSDVYRLGGNSASADVHRL